MKALVRVVIWCGPTAGHLGGEVVSMSIYVFPRGLRYSLPLDIDQNPEHPEHGWDPHHRPTFHEQSSSS